MKILLQLFMIGMLFSCDKSSSTVHPVSIVGEWKVTELRTAPQFTGVKAETKTEANLGFTQTLVLKKDGTYIKTRISNGQAKELNGTYTDTIIEGTHHVSLKYPTDKYGDLYESCFATGEPLELKDGLLLNNFWPACDGPYTLKYRKIK